MLLPFAKGISLKKRIRLTVLYPKRKRIVARFEDFKKNCLKLSEYFTTESELKVYLNRYDVVVFGSDQIWNNNTSLLTSISDNNERLLTPTAKKYNIISSTSYKGLPVIP